MPSHALGFKQKALHTSVKRRPLVVGHLHFGGNGAVAHGDPGRIELLDGDAL